MSMDKKDILQELKQIWVEMTPENPIRDILHHDLMNMLAEVTDDKELLLDLDYLLVEFYCIGEAKGFNNGVDAFRRLMEE